MKQNQNLTKILFADDHQIVREGLARLIERESDLKIVAEADNGQDAIRLAKELRPDLIVLDLKMPIKDGATAAMEFFATTPPPRSFCSRHSPPMRKSRRPLMPACSAPSSRTVPERR